MCALTGGMEGTSHREGGDRCSSRREQHTGGLHGRTDSEASRHTEEANVIGTKRVGEGVRGRVGGGKSTGLAGSFAVTLHVDSERVGKVKGCAKG